MERSWDSLEAWQREATRLLEAGKRPTVAVLCRRVSCSGVLRSRWGGVPLLGDVRYCGCPDGEVIEDVIDTRDIYDTHGVYEMVVPLDMRATEG